MSRKDYIAIAKALRNARPGSNPSYSAPASPEARQAWMAACCGVADVLTKDNARFDSDRFLAACGV